MARISLILTVTLACIALASGAPSRGPAHCRRSVPYSCLMRLFRADKIVQASHLKDVDVLNLGQYDMEELKAKAQSAKGFCDAFIASTKCGRAGKWYECPRDIAAVTSMVQTIQRSADMEWKMPIDQVEATIKLAAVVCNESAGVNELLNNRECIVDSFENSNDHFRLVQKPRLEKIISSDNFDGKCYDAQAAIYDTVNIIKNNEKCSEGVAELVFSFLNATVAVVPNYKADKCPIVFGQVPMAPVSQGKALTNAEWCPRRTTSEQLKCMSDKLKGDVLRGALFFRNVNPVTLISMTREQIEKRVNVLDAFCDYINSTATCTPDWWECETHVKAMTRIINDLIEVVSDQYSGAIRRSPDWVQTHFKFGANLCKYNTIETILDNFGCVEDSINEHTDIARKLQKYYSGEISFDPVDDCQSVKSDLRTVGETIDEKCKGRGADYTRNLLGASFLLVRGYSNDACDVVEQQEGNLRSAYGTIVSNL